MSYPPSSIRSVSVGFRWMLVFAIFFLGLVAVEADELPKNCPHCGGQVTTVEKVSAKLATPIRNANVWSPTACMNWFFGPECLICQRCWLARSRITLDDARETWMRSSEEKESFHRPLAPALRNLPAISGGGFLYHQIFVGTRLDQEGASGWCEDRPELEQMLRAYSEKNGLQIEVDRSASQEGKFFVEIKCPRPNDAGGKTRSKP